MKAGRFCPRSYVINAVSNTPPTPLPAASLPPVLQDNLLDLLEMARLALRDMRPELAHAMDLDDAYLNELHKGLDTYLQHDEFGDVIGKTPVTPASRYVYVVKASLWCVALESKHILTTQQVLDLALPRLHAASSVEQPFFAVEIIAYDGAVSSAAPARTLKILQDPTTAKDYAQPKA